MPSKLAPSKIFSAPPLKIVTFFRTYLQTFMGEALWNVLRCGQRHRTDSLTNRSTLGHLIM